MTVYASTACVDPRRELWETLAACREAGIGAVELGATRLEDRERLTERLQAEPLVLLVHNYFPPPAESFVVNLASADAGVRERSLALVVEGIELCAALGAPFYSVHAGFVHDPDGWDGRSFTFPDATAPETVAAEARFRDALAAALAHAQAAGVGLLVENNVCTAALRGKLLLQTADEFERLLEAVGDPALGVLVDTGHLNVSAHTLGFDRAEFVRRLEPRIRAWHLHDNDGSADTHDPAAEGGWALECVRRPALRSLPVIVEAKFDSFEALSRYVGRLERELART